jgi:AraC-like DNA-binding protein
VSGPIDSLSARNRTAGSAGLATVDHAAAAAPQLQEAHQPFARGHSSASDVALLLGYSEPAAFHRAFRRWTGKTPAEYAASMR